MIDQYSEIYVVRDIAFLVDIENVMGVWFSLLGLNLWLFAFNLEWVKTKVFRTVCHRI